MCLDRLGKLEIPNGIAGAAGPAGANGAGWESGGGPPLGPPTADVLFYLNTVSGELSKWNSSTLSWDSVVASIFGADGSQWITGTGVPTSTSYPAGTLYLDVGGSSPTKGNIYEYNGVSWGASIGNIKGQDGTNGVNGTGLLGSAYSIAPVTSNSSGNVVFPGFEITVNGQNAFPTLGSVVKITAAFKSVFSPNSLTGQTNGKVYFSPRIINVNTSAIYDITPDSIDTDTTGSLGTKIMLGVNTVNDNATHGLAAPFGSGYEYSNSGLPNVAKSVLGINLFPIAHTKYVVTAIRSSATAVIVSVDWTTTTRYGTYTGFYAPAFTNSLDFSSSGGIAFNVQATVDVPLSTAISIDPVYQIVEKSIL